MSLLASVAIEFVDQGLTSNRYALFLHLSRYPSQFDAGNAAGRAARYPSTDLMDAWKDLVQHRYNEEAGRLRLWGKPLRTGTLQPIGLYWLTRGEVCPSQLGLNQSIRNENKSH